jgi:hypothetical protein
LRQTPFEVFLSSSDRDKRFVGTPLCNQYRQIYKKQPGAAEPEPRTAGQPGCFYTASTIGEGRVFRSMHYNDERRYFSSTLVIYDVDLPF